MKAPVLVTVTALIKAHSPIWAFGFFMAGAGFFLFGFMGRIRIG